MKQPGDPRQEDPNARRFEIEGRELGYPTRFRDGSSISGIFLVRSGVARDLIAESGFQVAEVAPGRAVFVLAGVHYTDTDCGAYEETTMSFFVEKVGERGRVPYLRTWSDIFRGRIASYTWALQVTTALSREAGLQMWGFPKTLEEIDFERAGGHASFTLRMDGQRVFRYSVPARGTRQPPPLTSAVYSVFEGAQHVSSLTQRYEETGYRPGGGELSLGGHPLAERLRALGVSRRPLLATWNGHLAFDMTAPEKL